MLKHGSSLVNPLICGTAAFEYVYSEHILNQLQSKYSIVQGFMVQCKQYEQDFLSSGGLTEPFHSLSSGVTPGLSEKAPHPPPTMTSTAALFAHNTAYPEAPEQHC